MPKREEREMEERENSGKMGARKKEIYGKMGVEMGEEEKLEYEVLEERKNRKQKQERKEKIAGSKYNRWYKVIRKERIPEYLKKDREERS